MSPSLSSLLYSLLYSTLVNSLLLIITNQSDIFDLTCFVKFLSRRYSSLEIYVVHG